MVGDEGQGQGVYNKESREKMALNVGRQRCEAKELKRVVKWVADARKVWGTLLRIKSLVMRLQKRWLRWVVGRIWVLCTEAGRSGEWEGWVVICSEP